MTDINAAVRLSYRTSNTGPDKIHLTVTDDASGIEFLDVALDPAAVFGLIGNIGTGPVPAEVRGLDKVGLVREHITEHHKRRTGDGYGSEPPRWVLDLPAPDGFARERVNRNNRQEWVVTFARYVPPTAGIPADPDAGDTPDGLCWSWGPRIGDDTRPVCKQPFGHDGPHRGFDGSGFESETWGGPLLPVPEDMR